MLINCSLLTGVLVMMANQLNASLVLNVMLGTPKTKQLIEALLESLKTWDINIKDYRGQTFDNASNAWCV
jgi:hypothetical protein